MPEEKLDVKQEETPSTPDTPVETQPASGEQVEPTTTQESPSDAGEPSVNMVPAYKVDEWKRKHNDLLERMPEYARQAAREASTVYLQQNQKQDRTKRIVELKQFAADSPEHAISAQTEISNLEKEENREMLSNVVEEKFKAFQEKSSGDQRKQQAYRHVAQTYPEAFQKDASGRPLGFNPQHPITQTIYQLMQDKRFSEDPDGLTAAADIAFARYTRSQAPQAQQKVKKLKGEIKSLQKGTHVEGGGVSTQEGSSSYQSALDTAKKTGRMGDAKSAMKEIFKNQGILTE